MADGSITAGIAAGGSAAARAKGVATPSRVNALRPASAINSAAHYFNQSTDAAHTPDNTAITVQAPEPGNARLSSNIQLILAETRAQEDQSSFLDRSTLDQAVNSYTQSQASVRETIGLAQLSAGLAESRSAGSPPPQIGGGRLA